MGDSSSQSTLEETGQSWELTGEDAIGYNVGGGDLITSPGKTVRQVIVLEGHAEVR